MSVLARPKKRRRIYHAVQARPSNQPTMEPFGFNLRRFIAVLPSPGSLPIGKHLHNIQNYIKDFDQNGQPVFQNPGHVYNVTSTKGMMANVVKGNAQFTSTLHTSHTVHLYNMAHNILAELRKQAPVQLLNSPSTLFRHVDLRTATFNKRHKQQNIVYLNAQHLGVQVVLKTTSDPATMLKYVLEAVIHILLKANAPSCAPPLYFVGLTESKRLVVCTKQLHIPSVSSWVNTLHRRDNSHKLYYMLLNVCRAFIIIQRDAKFTHRDCHTLNVYYDEAQRMIQFIDFDWSSIRWNNNVISVPRFLYDTTRPGYGTNKSVDLCIFLRCLGKQVRNADIFMQRIWKPLMQRYEDESKQSLLSKYAGRDKVPGEISALQLYKMGLQNRKYSHANGIEKHGKEFDYYMGYYEWSCMTPRSILQFLNKNRF